MWFVDAGGGCGAFNLSQPTVDRVLRQKGTMPGDTSVSVSIFVLWVLFCCVCAAQFVFAGGARRVFFAAGVFCCGCSGRRAASD